jgi:hypothetical protein
VEEEGGAQQQGVRLFVHAVVILSYFHCFELFVVLLIWLRFVLHWLEVQLG